MLFFTGHFGFWELHAIVHGLQLQPIGVLARALDNPASQSGCSKRCARAPATAVIYRQGAVRRVLKTLDAGQGVAMLIDQHMHSPDAIWVDFFERPAATTSTLAALALRTGAPVVPVFALPVAGGRYRMIYEHAVEPPERMHRTRFASSRSAAPTCWRCTCGGIRSCGCGCIADGAMRRWPT